MIDIDDRFAKTLLGARDDEEVYLFLRTLLKKTREGAASLFYPGIQEKVSFLLQEEGPIVSLGDAYYLRRNWESETRLLVELKKMLEEKVEPLPFSPPSHLYPAQQKALLEAGSKKISVISGGPGSGKTRVAKEIFASFLACNPNAQIIATAPTGKAISRLQHPGVVTKTLHRLLSLTEKERQSRSWVDVDLLLVDECSMIDLSLFEELFTSLSSRVRLVLVGDPDQLSPIGTRGIFKDLTNMAEVPHTHLDQTKRTDKKGLLSCARLILEGKGRECFDLIQSGAFPEITFAPLAKSPPLVTREGEVLLSPFATGVHGSQNCNSLSYAAWKGESIPILITKNDYHTNLMNGDIGYIRKGKAYFSEDRSFPLSLLPPYEYAFALTIHKSQGSEFPHVILLLPEGSEEEGLEILYTALTRAQETLTIVSTQEIFLRTATKRKEEFSLFQARFKTLTL